jgi:hypothetical protein
MVTLFHEFEEDVLCGCSLPVVRLRCRNSNALLHWPMASDDVAFAEAIQERVDWRLETYLSRPGPGQVIPHGNSACIMLGNASGDGLPRSGGWKVIKINGAFKYAKFARVAINWIATEPDGQNMILPELQMLLGSDLLEFNRPQRVMIAAESDSDCWQVSAT